MEKRLNIQLNRKMGIRLQNVLQEKRKSRRPKNILNSTTGIRKLK